MSCTVTYCRTCGKPHTLTDPLAHSAPHENCNGEEYLSVGCWWTCEHCKSSLSKIDLDLAKHVNWYSGPDDGRPL